MSESFKLSAKSLIVIRILLCVLASSVFLAGATTPAYAKGKALALEALFTPGDDIEGRLAQEIRGAHDSVLMQAYLLTNKKIIDALAEVAQRGVRVDIQLDGNQLRQSGDKKITPLIAVGVHLFIVSGFNNVHNKVILIDAQGEHPVLITGSFNFTWSAQHKNTENILIVRDNSSISGQYLKNWKKIEDYSAPYTPPA